MQRPSLTLRLTLLFAGASTVVLVVLGSIVGSAVRRHFVEIDRDELLGKVHLVAHLLSGIRDAGDLRTLPGRMQDALVGHTHLEVRATTPDGTVLYASPNASFPAAAFPARPVGDAAADVLTWEEGGETFRGLMSTVPTSYPALPVAHVAVALNIHHHEVFLRAFERSLWAAVAASALLIAVLGWWAARRGLRPVREMAEVAQRINASRLNDRLRVETLPEEITELAEAFNDMLGRLEDSFRRLSDYSSDLAHEFKTPLSNMMTQTEVALSRPRTAEEYREVLYSSLEECGRLARTVSDMLFVATAEHGQIIPTVERVDLAHEIRALFEFFDAFVEERGVRLTATGAGFARGDRLMLRRALANLLSNAIAHAGTGEVRVEIGGGSEEVRIAIENRGETIPPDHLPRLFDRFYRVDPVRDRSSGGTGLGLTITRSIVEAHGGRIEVISADGVTRFTITLPSTGADASGSFSGQV